MTWSNRVIWSEGTFLQPQHFQQHDRYLEDFVESRTRALSAYGWGFAELAIDAPQLAYGKLALRSARGVLPDGTPFDCPGRDPLPRPLDIPATLRDADVVLALPVRQPGLEEADLRGAEANGIARYVAAELEVRDSNASFDRSALIQIGRLGLRLLPATDDLHAYACLAVGHVVERRQDSNQVVLDTSHVPPCLDVAADSTLTGYLRDIAGLLRQRGDELAERLGQPGAGGVAEIADYLWLITINRAQPLFAHLERTSPLHPERLYVACAALAGELATYTQESRRPLVHPEYRHGDLASCFRPLIDDIRRSLSMVLERTAVPIELEARPHGFRLALVPDAELLRTARFILAAKSQQPGETIRVGLPKIVKIGPPRRIRQLVDLNLPGVGLRSLPVVPRQIPYHAGLSYFELDRGGELWNDVEASGALALHVAGEIPGLQLELWAIRG
jgi:type VI secretion system protein ImpJ